MGMVPANAMLNGWQDAGSDCLAGESTGGSMSTPASWLVSSVAPGEPFNFAIFCGARIGRSLLGSCARGRVPRLRGMFRPSG